VHVRADRRKADGHVAAEAPSTAEEADVYLTDEVFLYRVVGPAATSVEEIVELEDCYGLDVVRVPLRDLRPRRLRPVTPVPPET